MTRQIYNYVSTLDTNALTTAVAGNHVGGVSRLDVGSSQYVAIDFLPDETTTESSAVQTIATSAPYNLTLASTDSTTQADQWTPLDFGLALVSWLNPGNIPHIWQEGSTLQQITPGAVSSTVGSVQDPGPQAHHWTNSNTIKPTLATDGAPEQHITFAQTANSGSGSSLAVNTSTNSLAFIHNTGIFSFHIALRVANNGVQLDMVDSNSNGTAGAYGIVLRRLNTNVINVRVTANLGANTYIWNVSTTGTLQTTDGMVLLSVWGDGTTLNIQIGNKTLEQFTRSNAPPNATPAHAMTSDLWFGRQVATGATALSGDVRFVVILNRASTSTDRTLLTNFMGLVRTSTRKLFRVASVGFIQPCLHFHDLSTPSLPGGGGMWTSSARTTPVASDGDTIAVVDHAPDPTNSWGRALGGGSINPVYRPALTVPGGEWNGVASPSNTNLPIPGPQWGGAWTVIVIAQNRDQTNGSHMIIASGAHFPLTGNNYASNPGPNQPYTTCHFSGTHVIGGTTVPLPALNPQAMMAELTRNGNSTRLRCSKDNTHETSGTVSPNDNTSQWTPLNMGNQTISGWEMDGYISFFGMWPVVLTRVEVDSYLMPQLQAKFPGLVVYS